MTEIPAALTPEEWTFPHHAMWCSPKMGIVARVRVGDSGVLEIHPPNALCAAWDGHTLFVPEADDRHALAALERFILELLTDAPHPSRSRALDGPPRRLLLPGRAQTGNDRE